MNAELAVALRNYGNFLREVGSGVAWLLRRLLAPWTVDESLRRKNGLLQRQLEAAKLENDLLAQLNVNLTEWLKASTAAAVQTARMLGVESPKDR